MAKADGSISDVPYAVSVVCGKTNRADTVFFYEVAVGNVVFLRFNGCDHQWDDDAQCRECHEAAYKKLLSGSGGND